MIKCAVSLGVSNICLTSFQSVGLPKWSSTEIRKQEVHTNGPVLDDVVLADPEVAYLPEAVSDFIHFFSILDFLKQSLSL